MIPGLLLAWIVSISSHAQELYRAEDQRGNVIYTDNAGNVPVNATVQRLERHTQADQTANAQNQAHFFTPFSLSKSGHLLVEVALIHGTQSIKAHLVYDTGAPSIHIHRRIAKALQLKPIRIIQNRLSDGNNEKTTPMAIATVTMKLGPVKLEQTPVIWNTSNTYLGPPWDFDGMLGMDLIRQYDTRIDYEKKRIEWSKRKTK